MPGKTKDSRDMKNHISGIYMITNKTNGKVYIGQSKSCTIRWGKHKYALKTNKHANCYLQNAFNKDGIDAFEFAILEECLLEERDEREIYWITYYNSTNDTYGYNFESGGHKNKIQSIETGIKKSLALTGIPLTEETKDKISKSMKGRKQSKEAIEKRRISNIGKHNGKRSEETKQKMAKAKLGKKCSPMTQECKNKIRNARILDGIIPPGNKGIKFSEEWKSKLGESKKGNKYMLGKHHSEKTKQKIRDSLKNKAKGGK